MLKRLCFVALTLCFLQAYLPAQTTNGLITGSITDSSSAAVPKTQITVTNEGTGMVRTTTSNESGIYIVPQLSPGIYDLSITRQGFANQERRGVQLEVNQSVTLDFKLGVASAAQTVEVTGAAPALNTTSPTLTDVVGHDETVDLPLDGREFTQLTLLTPGAAPRTTSQQSSFTVALGAGGISPSVNGQRGEQNNFTMDGVLNNAIYTNTWAIAPPPDALQEFAVQSHITDAQFAVSSGANINVVSRSGTNSFHGALWEFLRNDALDAQTFPNTFRLPYRQNQYGLYFGGPVLVPHLVNGRNNTWFSLYWEGFRSAQSNSVLSSTLTPAMVGGDFSALLGARVGTDSLGRPEYANEIYDPLTSRPDPKNPGVFLRDPFPGNVIPGGRLNPASLLIIQKYYPAPNLSVPEGTLPNYVFTGVNSTTSDVFGIRLDHQFSQSDSLFIRFNRSNQHVANPEQIASYSKDLSNYSQTAAAGITHLFSSSTILTLRYGYTYTNFDSTDQPSGAAFNQSIGITQAAPAKNGISLGPNLALSNGYNGVSQFAIPLGPIEGMDYHLDLSKVAGNHTLGVGAIYYHILGYDDGWGYSTNFAQNATSQNATSGPTGYGPASFLLGALDSYSPRLGDSAMSQTTNWWGLYGQDQWRASKNLVLTVGLRWDYVAPPNFHKAVSGLDVITGTFVVTQPVPPLFPSATGRKGYFVPQYDGWEPRFGITYQANKGIVLHGAFAILDDHNNNLVQLNQNLRATWPSSVIGNFDNLDLGIPTTYINALPSAVSLLPSALTTPYVGYGITQDNKIPYSMQFNAGLQQELTNSMVMKIDYVGSLSRHQYLNETANMALYPGPGPISARQPFAQYGGPFNYNWNEGTGNYNALQAELTKRLSSGLFFRASYTWSKSFDWQSDPYGNQAPNFYDLPAEYGPSEYSLKHMFVFSGVYQLPVGRGKNFWSSPNRYVQTLVGNWNLGTIITHDSGQPFSAMAGGDVANTGGPDQRAERIGPNPYATGHLSLTGKQWLNPASFEVPASYTYGNESRDDLVGPGYTNVDLSAYKNFPLFESATLQFRGEFFNSLNHTNYSVPNTNLQSGGFGLITSAQAQGRQIQFAVKALF
jgi:hypothetical protein